MASSLDIKRLLAACCLSSMFFVLSFTPTKAMGANQDRLYLKYAEKAVGGVAKGRQVRRLIGKVEFIQGDARMLCDSAVQYVDDKYSIFTGNVRIYSGSRSLLADKVTYFEETRLSIAEGHVVFKDSLQTLKSERATYNENENTILANTKVIILDDENHFKLTCGKADYRRDDGYAIITENPLLIRYDSTGVEDIRLTGEKMELFDDGDRVVVSGDVTITRKKMDAHCGTAELVQDDNVIRLTDHPRAKQKFTDIVGSEIALFFKDEKLTGLQIKGNATVTSKIDTLSDTDDRVDLLCGDSVYIAIKDDVMDSVYVSGRATSYFHVIEDSVYQGLNKIIGDEIYMSFKDSQLQEVRVKSLGVSSGKYFPPRLDTKLENELRQEIERRINAE